MQEYCAFPESSEATSLVVNSFIRSVAPSPDVHLAHVAHVEDTDRLPDGVVFGPDGVELHRHLPAPRTRSCVPRQPRGGRPGWLSQRHHRTRSYWKVPSKAFAMIPSISAWSVVRGLPVRLPSSRGLLGESRGRVGGGVRLGERPRNANGVCESSGGPDCLVPLDGGGFRAVDVLAERVGDVDHQVGYLWDVVLHRVRQDDRVREAVRDAERPADLVRDGVDDAEAGAVERHAGLHARASHLRQRLPVAAPVLDGAGQVLADLLDGVQRERRRLALGL